MLSSSKSLSTFSTRKVLNRFYSLSLDNINPFVKNIEYAVRGPIVKKAEDIENQLKAGVKKPFTEVIRCNIGDCHAMGQSPITFFRQVVALCVYPNLFNDSMIPSDAKDRAQRILDSCGGWSLGAYSNSMGVEVIRQDISKFIEARDGIPCDSKNIFLSTGASESIKSILQLIASFKDGKERSGVMVPIPQYPLYSATNSEYNACQINYFLDETKNWSLNPIELQRALDQMKSKCIPKAIVVINPGNPTGQVLEKIDIENVIKFAKQNKLLILADEVYQHNVYPKNKKFYSFKKVLHDMGTPYSNSVELASFMSASKGYMGECGFRGGYCELINFNQDVIAQLYKALSAKLCCSVAGQAMMGAIVNPPKENEPSYQQFFLEKNNVLGDLALKAKLATDTFNSMPGFKCNEVSGAMYAFPKIDLPPKLIAKAKELSLAPDAFYCFSLLEETGVCVVPGSGFGQLPDTHHFRMTILPPVEKLKVVMEKFLGFHEKFINKYK